MTSFYRNITIRGLIDILAQGSGDYKTSSGKTILISKPSFDEGREETKTEETLQDALRKAATYANFAHRQEIYINRAREKHVPAYSIAIDDWFGPPTVLLVSVAAWTGKPGQTIRVKAKDNVWVAGVTVIIRDAEGKVLETGEAVPSKSGCTWWKYVTKTRTEVTPFPHVEAIARDLAGNQGSFILC